MYDYTHPVCIPVNSSQIKNNLNALGYDGIQKPKQLSLKDFENKFDMISEHIRHLKDYLDDPDDLEAFNKSFRIIRHAELLDSIFTWFEKYYTIIVVVVISIFIILVITIAKSKS